MQRKCIPLFPPTSQMLTHWCSAHYLCNSLLSHIYNPNLRENITFCTMFCLLFLDPWVILSIVWKSIEIITFYWGSSMKSLTCWRCWWLVSLSSICVHLSPTGQKCERIQGWPQGRPVFACSCFYSILLPPRFQQLHTNIAPLPTKQKRRIKETMQADTCASLYLSLNVCIMDG